MTNLYEFTSNDIDDYQHYVDAHDNASAYHNKAWGESVSQAYGFTPKYFALKDENSITAVLPCILMKTLKGTTNLCSLPYCDFGGVLANSSNAANQLKALVSELAFTNNWAFEYRERVTTLSEQEQNNEQREPSVNTNAIPDGTKVRMLYELHNEVDAHMASFKPKLRSQIKKAAKNGVTSSVVSKPTADDLNTFYHVFAANMRDLGSPVHAKKWFESIFNTYGEKVFLVLVHVDQQCVGGAVVIHTHNKAVIPWASTLRDFNKLAPNMLMYWEVISEAIRRGLPNFDFGRSGYNEGTYRFKKQWGATPEILQWQALNNAGKLVEETTSKKSAVRDKIEHIWQKMPIGLTTAIGPKIRKYISL